MQSTFQALINILKQLAKDELKVVFLANASEQEYIFTARQRTCLWRLDPLDGDTLHIYYLERFIHLNENRGPNYRYKLKNNQAILATQEHRIRSLEDVAKEALAFVLELELEPED